ncbi:MAG: hypothetical protein CMP33_00455 [Rickettsiales bacterium]|jgi:hypothetical protein|nr:hypothetical protein [Rickettsiales bacterium]|tara:strand:+ start:25495 stop:26073 length:579 start_codon:yes stop_codon:yes gene_type:complete
MPDIDIDFADRDIILERLNHRVAKLDTGKKHNTGVYFTEIPHNPVDNLATIDYDEAEERKYFKIDFLNVFIYKQVKDEDHLVKLMSKEPLWDLLTESEFSNQLFHVGEHSTLLKKLSPKSIQQLAATLAIIRPAKRHLENETWDNIMKQVWVKPKDGSYFFKKAHAVAYAHAIVVHMNLICEQLESLDKPKA